VIARPESIRSASPPPLTPAVTLLAASGKTAAIPPANAGAGPRQPSTAPARRDSRRDAAAKNDSLLRDLRGKAREARTRAAGSGATAADLAAGDAQVSAGEALASRGRSADAVTPLSRAIAAFAQAEQQARTRAASAAAASPSAPRVETQPPTPAPLDPGPLIDAAIASYARALETKDMAQVRRANSGMSTRQEQDLVSFFKDVKNLKVSLRVTNKTVTGDTAEADVEGTYQFVLDRQDRGQPVRLHVTLVRAGTSWRITAITQ